jgi:hypothetical protein
MLQHFCRQGVCPFKFLKSAAVSTLGEKGVCMVEQIVKAVQALPPRERVLIALKLLTAITLILRISCRTCARKPPRARPRRFPFPPDAEDWN